MIESLLGLNVLKADAEIGQVVDELLLEPQVLRLVLFVVELVEVL